MVFGGRWLYIAAVVVELIALAIVQDELDPTRDLGPSLAAREGAVAMRLEAVTPDALAVGIEATAACGQGSIA